jgi:hypothetical protein
LPGKRIEATTKLIRGLNGGFKKGSPHICRRSGNRYSLWDRPPQRGLALDRKRRLLDTGGHITQEKGLLPGFRLCIVALHREKVG